MKSLDFYRYALFALTADGSRSSTDFRNDRIFSVWSDVQLSIVERCYELQAGSNLKWNEPVHSLSQYPPGNPPGLFLDEGMPEKRITYVKNGVFCTYSVKDDICILESPT